jgi:hypothetical protein
MGAVEARAFLNMLTNERKVSALTHNQALNAIAFCTARCWAWLGNVNRPTQKRRIPSVLTNAK